MSDKKIKFQDGRPRGLVIAVSAPSGAGKTTLCNMITAEFKDIRPSISYTTRQKRPNEIYDVSYHFIEETEFDKMIKNGEFIEWAVVFGKKYGTAFKSILDENSFLDTLLEIDVQGVENLIRHFDKIGETKRLITIFVSPPSYEELIERLKKRGDVGEKELKTRSEEAFKELGKSSMYDYIVTNDDVNKAYFKLKSIIISERCKNWASPNVSHSDKVKI